MCKIDSVNVLGSTQRLVQVQDYVPNQTWLMPQELAEELYRDGRVHEQLPAGTYARKVLEPQLIDLSWSSSRLRLRYREHLTEAIGLVVRERKSAQAAVAELQLTDDQAPGFSAMLLDELKKLEVFNCARYRLSMAATQAWIDANRPH